MHRRTLRIRPAATFADVRAEHDVPAAFPAEVEAEAAAARDGEPRVDRTALPVVTVDPPGARDLDQALHIEPRAGGWRVRYAIADVGAFVVPGSALDRETHRRGTTIYAPDGKTPLHPPVLSEGSASLLPDVDRPAVLWTLDLDDAGALTATHVERALVRSRAQLTYDALPDEIARPLREVGELRLRQEQARGGVRLAVPSQEVECGPDRRWTLRYRAPLPSEDWNAQISLLCGTAAARLMLDGGIGVLRTQAEPERDALERLRRQASALGIDWPADVPYPALIRRLDPADPSHAALLSAATSVGRGARYTAVMPGAPPKETIHWALAGPYAHVTAPLRRLADRYALETCVALCAGEAVPQHVLAALPQLPAEMLAADRRAGAVERAIVDLVEALLLQDRVGETFDAVAIDERSVALADPAVRAPVEPASIRPGEAVRVVLREADPVRRRVTFAIA